MAVKIVESTRSLADIARDLPEVCARHKFGVLGSIDIRQKLKEKGIPFEGESLIFEVCNPEAAKRVLEDTPAIAAALPCRIAVYREDGKTRIATILPTALLSLFPNPELKPVAEEVERTLESILKELV